MDQRDLGLPVGTGLHVLSRSILTFFYLLFFPASLPPFFCKSIQNMTSTFKRELARFDSERVLPAWDGLLAKQQNTLESLGVPTMFSTTAKADREVGHIDFSREFTISSSPRVRV